MDLYIILTNNTANILHLHVNAMNMKNVENSRISPAYDESASHNKLDLNPCRKLKRLELYGDGILLKDSASSATSEVPVWIILDISDPTQCTDTPHFLFSLEDIRLHGVTFSYTWLCSLLRMLPTRDHLKCTLMDCYITSCVEGAVSTSGTTICVSINTVNKEISLSLDDDTGLWEALRSLNIKRLSLNGDYIDLRQLQTLIISVGEYSHNLWEALRDLSIKSLSLRGGKGGISMNHDKSLSQSISSHTQLETLSIEVDEDSPGLLEALHGLNIKSLSLVGRERRGVKVNNKESFCQSLSSLTQLETLYISVLEDSPGLWEAFHGLNINSLSLSGGMESLSHSLSSLTQLETLSISVDEDSPGLWEALHGLNIKHLSLSGEKGCLRVNHKDSWSESLSSLVQLETLSIRVDEDSPGLWKALHGLNIKSLSLSGGVEGLRVNHKESLAQSLLSLVLLESLEISVDEDSPGIREALHGLTIKRLCLRVGCRNVTLKRFQ